MKEELEEKVKEIKETTSRVNKHIGAFDSFFESEVAKKSNLKALEELFNNFIDLAYKHTTLYKFMLHHIADIDEKLRATFNEEQKELFEAYEYLTNECNDDFGLQSFVYGYSLGQQLQVESNIAMNEILPDLKKKLEK